MKQCKQCGRYLDDECFRKTKPRGRGVYKTKQGLSALCRECESLNVQAYNAIKSNNIEAMSRLREYYQTLVDAGRTPTAAAPRRLLGLDPLVGTERGKRCANPLLVAAATSDEDLQEHISKVRARSYSSFEEADRVHKALTARLKEAGLYEEASDLLDEWYME